jgi:hypothetical protein
LAAYSRGASSCLPKRRQELAAEPSCHKPADGKERYANSDRDREAAEAPFQERGIGGAERANDDRLAFLTFFGIIKEARTGVIVKVAISAPARA